MSDLNFLNIYCLESPKNKRDSRKHYIYKVNDLQINELNKKITIPLELKEFWKNYGYGFFHKNINLSIYRFMGPESFKMINMREDFYEFDPELEMYEIYENKLIFFEVNEGVYLLIEKEAKDGKNAIYYFEEKIADSLEEFLIKFDKNPHYFEKDNIE